MSARDRAAELYPYNGADPGIITALRSAFRAGAEWQAERAAESNVEWAVEIAWGDNRRYIQYEDEAACMRFMEHPPLWYTAPEGESDMRAVRRFSATPWTRNQAPNQPARDWDRVHNRPATVYTPPEDLFVRPTDHANGSKP